MNGEWKINIIYPSYSDGLAAEQTKHKVDINCNTKTLFIQGVGECLCAAAHADQLFFVNVNDFQVRYLYIQHYIEVTQITKISIKFIIFPCSLKRCDTSLWSELPTTA